MQESNFEKQVQEKMDELKINPSGEVWQKVAVAIEKRKGDRRIFAIIPLLILCMGSGVFILLNQTTRPNPIKTVSGNANAQKGNGSKNPLTENDSPRSGVVLNMPSGDLTLLNNSSTQKTGKNQPIQLHDTGRTAVSIITGYGKNPADKKAKDLTIYHLGKVNYKTGQKVNMNINSQVPEELGNEKKEIVDTSVVITLPIIIKPTVAINSQQDTNPTIKISARINQPTVDTISLVQKYISDNKVDTKGTIKSKQKSNWKLGFNFSMGLATTKSGYLGIIGLGNADESKALDPAQANTGTTGSGIPYTPAKIKWGAGIVMGVFIQKGISPKTNLLIGLNYKLFNSSMHVGSRVDSILSYGGNLFSQDNFFYRAGIKNNYTNQFHFIELPVSVLFKLGRQNKLPVYLNPGLTISQLLSTNALQFDALSGSYYRDNATFNKTQLNISAGLLFSLSGNANNPFLIGPDLNFSLNKMANSGLYKNRHYSYFGIQLQKTLGKK